VKAPILVEPYPTAAVSSKLARVQFKESMPWLSHISLGYWRIWAVTYSKSSPRGLDVPVRRACFPSTLSMVEYLQAPLAQCCKPACEKSYIHMPNAKL
jgi:hypothetical protein